MDGKQVPQCLSTQSPQLLTPFCLFFGSTGSNAHPWLDQMYVAVPSRVLTATHTLSTFQPQSPLSVALRHNGKTLPSAPSRNKGPDSSFFCVTVVCFLKTCLLSFFPLHGLRAELLVYLCHCRTPCVNLSFQFLDTVQPGDFFMHPGHLFKKLFEPGTLAPTSTPL